MKEYERILLPLRKEKILVIAAHLNLYSKPLKKIHSNGKVKKTKVKGLISNCKIHITSQFLYVFLII